MADTAGNALDAARREKKGRGERPDAAGRKRRDAMIEAADSLFTGKGDASVSAGEGEVTGDMTIAFGNCCPENRAFDVRIGGCPPYSLPLTELLKGSRREPARAGIVLTILLAFSSAGHNLKSGRRSFNHGIGEWVSPRECAYGTSSDLPPDR